MKLPIKHVGAGEVRDADDRAILLTYGTVGENVLTEAVDIADDIVRACNSHDELLEAAKHAAMEWRLHGQLTDSCRVLEAAVAKAEGTS